MITKELLFYIKQARTLGRSDAQIKSTLMQNGGWNEVDINEGLRQASLMDAQPTPPPVRPAVSPVVGASTLNSNIANPAAANARPMATFNPPPTMAPLSNMQGNVQPNAVYANRNQAASITQPAIVKKSHGVLIAFVLIVLIALGGGGYFFKDELKTLPVVKDFFPQTDTSNNVPFVYQPTPEPIPVAVTPAPANPTVENTQMGGIAPAPVYTPPTPISTQPATVSTTTTPPTQPVAAQNPAATATPPPIACALSTNYVPLVNIHPGAILTDPIKITSYKGKVTQLSWEVKDPTVSTVTPATGDGSTNSIKGIKSGLTQITVTDNAVGKDCTVSITVAVN